MFDIIEDWKVILDLLIAAPVAYLSPEEIATALGRGVEETTDLLSTMDAAEWLSVWDVEPGPLVTLSALAAHRLHVVLVEEGPEEMPRWAREDDPLPTPQKATDVNLTDYYASQHRLLDPHFSVENGVEDFESREARVAAIDTDTASSMRVEDLPLPTLILGLSLTPWPGPAEIAPGDVCPACAGRALGPHVYCLGCDAWGQDELLEKLAPECRIARAKRPHSARSSTPNASAASVAALTPHPPARNGGRRQSAGQVQRSGARHNARRNPLVSGRLERNS